uniref:LRRCT domain-containing protein n=1 Tax=Bracon brevicornis TaxID=1563983 RepID=A0A6V7KU85_9HYME
MQALVFLIISTHLFRHINCEYVKFIPDDKLPCSDGNGTILNLSNYNLDHIKGPLIESSSAVCIDLSNNYINYLEDNVFEMPGNLIYLNLTNNKLSWDFFKSFNHSTLRTLVLDRVTANNNRGYYSYEYSKTSLRLPELKYLYLRGNDIAETSTLSLGYLPKLTHLFLSHNRISKLQLPADLHETLTHLFLDDNRLSSFQAGDMKNLKVLHVDRNPISGICSGYCDGRISLGGAWNLEQLSLTKISNRLVIEEGAMDDLHNLKYLDLSMTGISESIDHHFRNLSNLMILKLSSNSLSTIPSVCTLEKLEELDMSNNQIQIISEKSFCSITSLKILNLSKNNISHLSSLPSSLRSLKSLDLRGNGLITLPEKFFLYNQLNPGRIYSDGVDKTGDLEIHLRYLYLGRKSLRGGELFFLSQISPELEIFLET